MGNFQHEPVMPKETHVGYVEGYLDALEKVQSFHERDSNLSVEDICFALKISLLPDETTSDGSIAFTSFVNSLKHVLSSHLTADLASV